MELKLKGLTTVEQVDKALKLRKALERKYSFACIKHSRELPKSQDGRTITISPTAYWHHTGVNTSNESKCLYRECTDIIKSYGDVKRNKIEEEVLAILKISLKEKSDFTECVDYDDRYYNTYYSVNGGYGRFMFFHEIVNHVLLREKKYFNENIFKNTMPKKRWNRLINLLKSWKEESKNMHYKLNGAALRINEKLN